MNINHHIFTDITFSHLSKYFIYIARFIPLNKMIVFTDAGHVH